MTLTILPTRSPKTSPERLQSRRNRVFFAVPGLLLAFFLLPPLFPTNPPPKPLWASSRSQDGSPEAGSPGAAGISAPQLLLLAVRQSVWGSGFFCKVRQQTDQFGESIVTQGTYYHAGQGSGKFRSHCRQTIGSAVQEIQQVSDGRLLWTSLGRGQALRGVMLDQVRAGLGREVVRDRQRPESSLAIAIGGVPEVLRSLYMQYAWREVWSGQLVSRLDASDSKDAPVKVWQLLGSLHLAQSGPPPIAAVDGQLASTVAFLPTDIRLTLSREESSWLQPIRIEYYLRTSPAPESGSLRLLSTLEYYQIEPLEGEPEEWFIVDPPSTIQGKKDETGLYLPLQPASPPLGSS